VLTTSRINVAEKACHACSMTSEISLVFELEAYDNTVGKIFGDAQTYNLESL